MKIEEQWELAGEMIEAKINQLWFDYFEDKCGWSGGVPAWFSQGMFNTIQDMHKRMYEVGPNF